MADCNLKPTQSIEFTVLHTFVLVFSFLFFLINYIYYTPPQPPKLLSFTPLQCPDVTRLEEEHLVEARRCP
jgi:hypothetical protein